MNLKKLIWKTDFITKSFLLCLIVYTLSSCKNSPETIEPKTPVVAPTDSSRVSVPKPEVPKVYNLAWQKVLGGQYDDFAFGVLVLADGSSLIAGNTGSNATGDVPAITGDGAVWITKLDVNGNKIWSKTYGSGAEQCRRIISTKDGNCIVVGSIMISETRFSSWIMKLNLNGDVLWQKTFGGTSNDITNAIVETSDGGLVLAGYASSHDGDLSGISNHGNSDVWVVKLSADANIIWQKTFGGSAFDVANAIALASDGGVLIAAYTLSLDGDVTQSHNASGGIYGDYWILKIDSSGKLIWQKALGGSRDENPSSILEASDKNIYVSGRTTSNDGSVSGLHGAGPNGWTVKLSPVGNLLWQKTLGGTMGDDINGMIEANDKSIVNVGFSNSKDGDTHVNHGYSDAWIVQLNTDGKINWQESVGGSLYDAATAVASTNDDGIIISGITASKDGDVSINNGGIDYWVIKLH